MNEYWQCDDCPEGSAYVEWAVEHIRKGHTVEVILTSD